MIYRWRVKKNKKNDDISVYARLPYSQNKDTDDFFYFRLICVRWNFGFILKIPPVMIYLFILSKQVCPYYYFYGMNSNNTMVQIRVLSNLSCNSEKMAIWQ